MASNRMLQFRTGGWVILLAVLVSGALGARILIPVFKSGRISPVGDRKNVATYGFDLSNLTIDRSRLVTGNMVKDAIRSLTAPQVLTPDAVAERNRAERGKYLVSSDWVIGLTRNGASRAYPLRVLNWHEIINDTLGGTEVVVTFNPLSYTAASFIRRIEGRQLDFGVSGLLYNSTLVMYDRRKDGTGESLWLPLTGRAISGPEAGKELKHLPSTLTTWSEWVDRHPDTTVVDGLADLRKHYEKDPYGPYYQRGMLRFPVSPEVPGDGPDAMTLTLLYRDGGRLVCLPLREGSATDLPPELAGIELRPAEGGTGIWPVRDGTVPAGLVYTFWFACYAEHLLTG
jgi:hypothetical protein